MNEPGSNSVGRRPVGVSWRPIHLGQQQGQFALQKCRQQILTAARLALDRLARQQRQGHRTLDLERPQQQQQQHPSHDILFFLTRTSLLG